MIVSDLETGHTMRRLHLHSSLYPAESFFASIEGEMIKVRRNNDPRYDWLPGAFGFTINGNRDRLYYSAVGSQDIFSVDLDKLCDQGITNSEVENTVKHVDYKVAPGTGIECDKQNRLYLSDPEHSAIWRRQSDGTIDVVAHNEKFCFSDHMLIANNGYLYITTSQYHHGSGKHFEEDERFPPFEVLRVFVDTTSTTLCSHSF